MIIVTGTNIRGIENPTVPLIVLDRDTPIARIVPYVAQTIEVRRATRRLRELRRPPSPAAPTDSLTVLLDDRRRR